MLLSVNLFQSKAENMYLENLLTWVTKVAAVINIRELIQKSPNTPLFKKCDFKHLALGIC